MADEPKDMEFADIRAALTGTTPTEKAPEAPPAEPVAEETAPVVDEATPPAEGEEKAPETEEKAPVEDENRKKRFSKLTKERDTERAARVALEARLAALEAARATSESARVVDAPVESDGKPVKPKVDDFPTWDAYSTALEAHEEKLTDWKVNQALAKKEQATAAARAKAEYDRVHSGWQAQVDAATEDNDDLEDAIKTVGESVAKKGIIEVIKESENGVKMVLYLHRNPAELAKVEGMSMASAARYLGRIEARIEGEVAAAPAKVAKTLPKPPAQLGGAPRGEAKSFDYQKASDADFKAQAIRDGLFSRR